MTWWGLTALTLPWTRADFLPESEGRPESLPGGGSGHPPSGGLELSQVTKESSGPLSVSELTRECRAPPPFKEELVQRVASHLLLNTTPLIVQFVDETKPELPHTVTK